MSVTSAPTPVPAAALRRSALHGALPPEGRAVDPALHIGDGGDRRDRRREPDAARSERAQSRAAFKPPFWQDGGTTEYLLGTDNLGRDVLSRIIAGARVSVIVSLYAIVFSGAIGTMLGIIAGYFGGIIDMIIVRIAEIKMAIPGLALALIFSATMEPGLSTVIIVIVLTYWTWYARIIRSEILSLRERDYVAFAKVAGCGSMTIFFRHLLPNIFNTLLVLMTLQVGQVILFEAALSFLGLGIQAPDTSWGLMLADARQYITYAWWGITMPGIAIMLTCLSSNLTGDWLRDLLDPKRRQL